MRPTTALNHNVVDLNALLHPGTVFEHPRDVVSHPTLSLSEKRAILGVGCLRDRLVPVAAGARRPEGAGHHRRNPGGPLRTGR
jgi:hypothetical protein